MEKYIILYDTDDGQKEYTCTTDKMTETQEKAYNAAYREFWKEVNARGDY